MTPLEALPPELWMQRPGFPRLAAALDAQLPDVRLACAVAEFTAIEGALACTRTAIQVHGGMGFTWEHDAHLYLKRAQRLAARLGGAPKALAAVAELAVA